MYLLIYNDCNNNYDVSKEIDDVAKVIELGQKMT